MESINHIFLQQYSELYNNEMYGFIISRHETESTVPTILNIIILG